MDDLRTDFSARPIGTYAPNPAQSSPEVEFFSMQANGDEALQAELSAFEGHVINRLEQMRLNSAALRTAEQFQERLEKNARRAQGKMLLNLKEDGSVDPTSGDGHAPLGLTHGWSKQGITFGAAAVRRMLFESAKRFYQIQFSGEKQGNDNLERALVAVVDDLLRRGEFFSTVATLMTDTVGRDGTVILRYEPAVPTQLQCSKENWEERPGSYRPIFTVWPLKDVFVTDYEKPQPRDQEGVWFLTPHCTLRSLEANEYVEEYEPLPTVDPYGQPQYRVLRSGKYRNLEKLRSIEREYDQSHPESGGKTSVFPEFTLLEFEGAIPIAAWVESGVFTPRLAAFFGLPLPDDPNNLRAWGAKLSRMTHWHVTYLSDSLIDQSDAPAIRQIGKHLLQFSPSAYKRPRNSMFVFRWIRDGAKFFGQSIIDVGGKLEDAADLILNYAMLAVRQNGDPAAMVDTKILGSHSLDDFNRLRREPGALIEATPGHANISEAIREFIVQIDPATYQRIGALRQEFEATTGVLAAAKGMDRASGTGTLGEIQFNDQKSQTVLSDLVVQQARELCRLIKCMIEDVLFFMGREKFLAYAREVAGYLSADLETLLTPSETDEKADEYDLEEQFQVVHPVLATADNAVIATVIERLFQVFGPQDTTLDRKKCAKVIFEINGIRNGEDLLTQKRDPLAPEEEAKQLAEGNWIAPVEGEDFATHLAFHQGMLTMVQEALMQAQQVSGGGGALFQKAMEMFSARFGFSPEQISNLAYMLPIHIQATQNIMQQMQAMQTQMMAIQAMQQGMLPQQGGQGPAVNNAPGDQFQQRNNLTQQTRGGMR
mgnify:CR=1 FL=1